MNSDATNTGKKHVDVLNMSGHFFHIDKKGLEKLVIFPDGEIRKSGLPSSSVWVFGEGHEYDAEILGPDVGCGISAFKTERLVVKEAADIIAEYLKDTGVLGRGNHFVDICSEIKSQYIDKPDERYHIILIHSDGKKGNNKIPKNIREAEAKIWHSRKFREDLGGEIAGRLGVSSAPVNDWSHNTIECTEDKIVYRKGAIKVENNGFHMLPIHLGTSVLVYTVRKENMPPEDSMPHGAGRKGPISDTKVSEEKVADLRKTLYIPGIVSDASLRSEHPDCYNDSSKIYEKLGKFMDGIGHSEIRAYIGKI